MNPKPTIYDIYPLVCEVLTRLQLVAHRITSQEGEKDHYGFRWIRGVWISSQGKFRSQIPLGSQHKPGYERPICIKRRKHYDYVYFDAPGDWLLSKMYSHEDNLKMITECRYLLLKYNTEEPLSARSILCFAHTNIFLSLIQRYGSDQFFDAMKPVLIDHEPSRELWGIGITRGGFTFLKVQDATTHRWHFLITPGVCSTCKEAVAWTFSLNTDEYHPVVET
jgi:hypothetical protein